MDIEYQTPKSSSVLIWLIGGITVILLILFFVAIVCYFFIGNTTPTHDIKVINNCAFPVQLLFGTPSQLVNARVLLPPQESTNLQASPGSNVSIAGLQNEDFDPNRITKVNLSLSGDGFTGINRTITDGSIIITDTGFFNDTTEDIYSVSIRDGYNIPITISSNSCTGPSWNYFINQTGENMCPVQLQYISPTGNHYQGCLPPCTALCPDKNGGFSLECPKYCCNGTVDSCNQSTPCQDTWAPQDYYTIFGGACPQCNITNCDDINFRCKSENFRNLTSYTVTFCPNTG